MEEQNRVNREKDINTQKQETEEVAGREKVGKGSIRKMGKQDWLMGMSRNVSGN